MLFMGIGTFFYKKSTTTLGPIHTTFFYYFFSIILAASLWFSVRDKAPVEKEALLWPALMAFFLCASVWTFSYALKTLDVSVASTIRGLSFVATIALAVVFYREELAPKDMVAVLLAVGSVVLFGLKSSNS